MSTFCDSRQNDEDEFLKQYNDKNYIIFNQLIPPTSNLLWAIYRLYLAYLSEDALWSYAHLRRKQLAKNGSIILLKQFNGTPNLLLPTTILQWHSV